MELYGLAPSIRRTSKHKCKNRRPHSLARLQKVGFQTVDVGNVVVD